MGISDFKIDTGTFTTGLTMCIFFCTDEDKQEEICKEQPETLTRLNNLSIKARRRMYARAMNQLQQVQLRSKEAVSKLAHTVDLVS